MGGWVGAGSCLLVVVYVPTSMYLCMADGNIWVGWRRVFLVLALEGGAGGLVAGRDCALRVRVCDEAGFSVEMWTIYLAGWLYLYLYSNTCRRWQYGRSSSAGTRAAGGRGDGGTGGRGGEREKK